LSREEQALLKIPAHFLNADEKRELERINEKLSECYNIVSNIENQEQIFKIEIPNLKYKCVDILQDAYLRHFVNAEIYNNIELGEQGLANVMIRLPDGEEFEYPLSPDESMNLIAHGIEFGIYSDDYPRMQFPDLAELQENIDDAKRR
jgi:hypothetical protein